MMQEIGRLIDELGVRLDLEDTQRLTSVFVIGKVMDLNNGNAYLVLGSNGLDWIDEGALIHAANVARTETVAHMMRHNGRCEHCTNEEERE
jgi:hypothetical protein